MSPNDQHKNRTKLRKPISLQYSSLMLFVFVLSQLIICIVEKTKRENMPLILRNLIYIWVRNSCTYKET